MFTLTSFRSPLLLAVLLGALTPAPETHSFDLTRDQKQSFTFAVDQPGKIVARVTWQGAPLAVSLVGPSGTVAQRTARGSVELVYSVTTADVSKGRAWGVALQSAERRGDVLAVVAKGTVTIKHPAGDIQKLEAQFDAQNKQWMARFRARAAQLELQAEAAQKAKLAQLQQTQGQARHREQAVLLQRVVALRAHAVAQPARGAMAGHQTGARPSPVVGSGGNAPEPLSITSLSGNEGQPGDAILITGAGFGQSAAASGAVVHLIVAPGKDVQLTPDFWSDNQIQTSIPRDITGVADNAHAAIYVKTAGSSSPLIPFHFKPAIVTTAISVKPDHADVVDESDCDIADDKVDGPGWVAHLGGVFCGGSGNDIWNRGQQLKNGWTVLSIGFGHRDISPDADVYVSQSHAGTADMSFTMHWWTSGGGVFGEPGGLFYAPVIYIQGPAGIPWQ